MQQREKKQNFTIAKILEDDTPYPQPKRLERQVEKKVDFTEFCQTMTPGPEDIPKRVPNFHNQGFQKTEKRVRKPDTPVKRSKGKFEFGSKKRMNSMVKVPLSHSKKATSSFMELPDPDEKYNDIKISDFEFGCPLGYGAHG